MKNKYIKKIDNFKNVGLNFNFMKKIGLVDLKGGFGNQIFQIAYALFLKDVWVECFIDKTFYKIQHPFPRNLEVDPGIFGLIEFKNNRIFFYKYILKAGLFGYLT